MKQFKCADGRQRVDVKEKKNYSLPSGKRQIHADNTSLTMCPSFFISKKANEQFYAEYARPVKSKVQRCCVQPILVPKNEGKKQKMEASEANGQSVDNLCRRVSLSSSHRVIIHLRIIMISN